MKKQISDAVDMTIKRIFTAEEINALTNLQKRKRVFDYLFQINEYDFELLNDILNCKPRDYDSEILAPLLKGKGVCNGISYAYKIILERLGIYVMLIGSNLQMDIRELAKLGEFGIDINKVRRGIDGTAKLSHMFTLVKNDDGYYSFDDITCAILNPEQRENFFNYDRKGCERNQQVDLIGVPSELLNYIADKESSDIEKAIEGIWLDKQTGFLKIPEMIKRYEESKAKSEMERLDELT